VEVLPDPVRLVAGTTLDTVLRDGLGQFGVAREGAEPLDLVLTCDGVLAALLQESTLSPGQVVRELDDGRFEVRASVPDSWELRWWILGRGPQVQVMAPMGLRREITESLRAACAPYSGDTTDD